MTRDKDKVLFTSKLENGWEILKTINPMGKVFSSKTREHKLKALGETESKFDFRIWVIIMEHLLEKISYS